MLPAPRDPLPPRAEHADPPPPRPEPPPLASLLTGLLRGPGAQAARALDGRIDGQGGAVLAEVGLVDGDDVPALVQLAHTAAAAGRGRGEWLEDVVVTLGRTVHVLRECGGAVLHVRLDPARGDVAAVRRALATAELERAVEAALRDVPEPDVPESDVPESDVPEPDVPEPEVSQSEVTVRVAPVRPDPERFARADAPTLPSMRPVRPAHRPSPRPSPRPRARPLARLPEPAPPPPEPPPVPLPRPSGDPRAQEPALTRVDGGVPATRTGALAVLALPPVAAPPEAAPPEAAPPEAAPSAEESQSPSEAAPDVPALPRRTPVAFAPPEQRRQAMIGPPVLRQPWASDVGTMRRLLAGLKRMG